MKLRNKKTGEIIECSISLNQWSEDDQEWYLFGNYDSLAELNEEWEDCKAVEPIIEDEKTRKVLKEWGELTDAKQFITTHCWNDCEKTTIFQSTDIPTKPTIELPGHIGKDEETYTREEL